MRTEKMFVEYTCDRCGASMEEPWPVTVPAENGMDQFYVQIKLSKNDGTELHHFCEQCKTAVLKQALDSVKKKRTNYDMISFDARSLAEAVVYPHALLHSGKTVWYALVNANRWDYFSTREQAVNEMVAYLERNSNK